MATTISNLVTPQQAALTSKIYNTPLPSGTSAFGTNTALKNFQVGMANPTPTSAFGPSTSVSSTPSTTAAQFSNAIAPGISSALAGRGGLYVPPTFQAPTNVSSFTPAQLAAFNSANSLGSGVATTGAPQITPQTTPSQTGGPGSTINQGPNAQQGTPSGTGGTGNTISYTPASTTNSNAAPASSLVSPGPAGTTGAGPLNQQQLLQQVEGLIQQQNAQQSGLTAQQQALASQFAGLNAGILNQPGELGYQTGRQAQLQQTYNTGEQALAAQQAQLAQYEQPQLSALMSAAGLSGIAPQLGQYGQTYYQYGQQGASGTGNIQLSGQPLTDVNNLSQAVANGTLDYSSALSQLSGYGTAVQNQLLPAIQKINPSFNANLSASSAQTQASGQQLQTQVNATTQALSTLQNFFNQLSPLQTQGIPLTNSIAQSLGQAFGSGTVSQYNTALTEARAQVIGTLTTTGMTPTDAQAAAQTYLPDGMTTQQLQANIPALKTFMQQKVDSFTKSGQQGAAPQTTTSTSGAIFDW